MGHSLGGGFVLLMNPLHNIQHDALILMSPAGLAGNNAEDFKASIERSKGLPFDFGTANMVQAYDCCIEKPGFLATDNVKGWKELRRVINSARRMEQMDYVARTMPCHPWRQELSRLVYFLIRVKTPIFISNGMKSVQNNKYYRVCTCVVFLSLHHWPQRF
ncbi:hypothetical protein [Endozoicomonas numazuensis]|uniref:Uncharacterized protein n=1 Tax=Endozoicomonas numazuensis TaxID=1137799 RepID=A0A081NMH7_9GAMM|nr:hypothetical protein [Endozoicomonas numazuensis]KEQ19650.1 hypothetical protein GZ78_07105 [Endozoicomonas numazuensis]